MIQRSLCLCEGKYIGIEYIYTIINGMQINDRDKLSWMREKAHSRQLFCPCGCGANLTVVAGDRNLREQHFRILDGSGNNECCYVEEGETSINSKVILKCWLDEKLHDEHLEARVPICDITDSERKYELTFLSRECGIAINYCRHRANLSKEKLNILEQNSDGLSVFHIVDAENEETNFQYPEGMMKIQERQGYCLALHIEGRDYEKAELKALIYESDLDGLWMPVTVAQGKLNEFGFGVEGKLSINGVDVSVKVSAARERFQKRQDFYREQREAYRRGIEEQRKRERQEVIRRENERRAEEERRKTEEEILMEEFWKNFPAEVDRNDKLTLDPYGVRWIKCKECGIAGKRGNFPIYGGAYGMNYGICKECRGKSKENDAIDSTRKDIMPALKDENICPRCGGRLRVHFTARGGFRGCSNYPHCSFTKPLLARKQK